MGSAPHGEAVAQSQRVAAQREALIDLVLGGSGPDLAAVTRMFADLTENHTARMKSLGLEAQQKPGRQSQAPSGN